MEETVLLRLIFCEHSKDLKDFSWYMWKTQNLIKKKKLRAKPIPESFKKLAIHLHLHMSHWKKVHTLWLHDRTF